MRDEDYDNLKEKFIRSKDYQEPSFKNNNYVKISLIVLGLIFLIFIINYFSTIFNFFITNNKYNLIVFFIVILFITILFKFNFEKKYFKDNIYVKMKINHFIFMLVVLIFVVLFRNELRSFLLNLNIDFNSAPIFLVIFIIVSFIFVILKKFK